MQEPQWQYQTLQRTQIVPGMRRKSALVYLRPMKESYQLKPVGNLRCLFNFAILKLSGVISHQPLESGGIWRVILWQRRQ